MGLVRKTLGLVVATAAGGPAGAALWAAKQGIQKIVEEDMKRDGEEPSRSQRAALSVIASGVTGVAASLTDHD